MGSRGQGSREGGKEVIEEGVVGVLVVGVGEAVVVIVRGGGRDIESRRSVVGRVSGRLWQLLWLCRVEVGALLVEVSLDHGDIGWWVAADLCGGEGGQGGEVTGVNDAAPSRQRGGEQRGVEEGNAVGNGDRICWEKSIGLEEGGPGGRDGGRWG